MGKDNFPGYRVPFILKDGTLEIRTRVVGGNKTQSLGAKAGHYLAYGIGKIYEMHLELKEGATLTMEVKDPGKVYEIIGINRIVPQVQLPLS